MKTVVVTGAAGGIGGATAIRLTNEGYRVAGLDIDAEGLDRVASLTGCTGYTCDVSDRDQVFDTALRLGPVDALVAIAGRAFAGSILTQNADDVRKAVDLNLLGLVWLLQAFTPSMTAGGSIVTTSSVAGRLQMPGVGLYPAAKVAIKTGAWRPSMSSPASQCWR